MKDKIRGLWFTEGLPAWMYVGLVIVVLVLLVQCFGIVFLGWGA